MTIIGTILAICLVLLYILGFSVFCYGWIDADVCGFSFKNVLILVCGIAMLGLWIFLIKRINEHSHEVYEKTHPIEIVTSIPPQIDTTITIRSGRDMDTTYTYIFKKCGK